MPSETNAALRKLVEAQKAEINRLADHLGVTLAALMAIKDGASSSGMMLREIEQIATEALAKTTVKYT